VIFRSAKEIAVELRHITFTGPALDDEEMLDRLHADLAGLLRQINGFIQFQGGLHVRGACLEPAWHSLRNAWDGEAAFHRLYAEIRPDDVPFAEDCLGDQFFLRDRRVWRLAAETGDVEAMGIGRLEFFEAVEANPTEFLSMNPLLQFEQDGGRLEPDQLLSAYPPFCMTESAGGRVSFAAISAEERRRFLADLAVQLRNVADGGRIEFRIKK
jgi:hypothetical protein